jgi:acyl transferase domain-containing protein/aryl carrier-like protein
LIKVVLALKHQEMPPAIHFHEPNPHLDFTQTPFFLSRELQGWRAGSGPRRAGVSSFGIGGTNAHAVLEEAPESQRPDNGHRDSQLLILSARSHPALQTSSRQLAKRLSEQPDLRLADVAYTLQVGRAAHAYRRFCVSDNAAAAVRALEDAVDPGEAGPAANDVPVVFMFPGQGSQHVHMAQGVYETEPTFREHLDQCAELLRPILGADLREILYPTDPQQARPGAHGNLGDTALCQPILFSVEYSLARLWQSWGAVPSIMIGHSLGEFVAACVAGVLSLEDALSLVSARGALMQRAAAGRMLAVALSRDEVLPLLSSVELAADNSDRGCVLSGAEAQIEGMKRDLEARGVPCTLLDTSHAFHSSLMDDVLAEFGDVLERVTLREVRIPYVSNVTGAIFQEGMRIPADYWLGHLRQTVEFSRGMRRLMQGSAKVFLEIGPGTVLSSNLRNINGSHGHTVVNSCRHHRAGVKDSCALMQAVGRAWQAGVRVDWPLFNARNAVRRVALPTYPLERKRHWIERATPTALTSSADQSVGRFAESAASGSGADRKSGRFWVPVWKQRPAAPSEGGRSAATSVLFDDGTPVCEALAKALASRSREIVRVRAGQSYSEGKLCFSINPREPCHYSKLMTTIAGRGQVVELMVHAWQINRRGNECGESEEALGLGFYSLLYLFQALETRLRSRPLNVSVVTSDAQLVLGDERCSPFAAMLAACTRVIAREFPNVICRCVDVQLGTDSAAQAAIGETAVREALDQSREPLVAYRGRSCFVPTYEMLSPTREAGSTSLLRAGGTYLITGGLGGIGLTLAEFLARSVNARIVLTGRSEFPRRGQWDARLAAHPEDAVSGCIRKIRALESCGADVIVLRADVSDFEQMRAAVSQTLERFGALHGVIHAAGVAGGGVISLKTRAMAEAVLAPKVTGALAVLDAVKDLDLDFIIACSSVASILTPAGQYDYCAANAFLDAFAHAHDRDGRTRVISINWDGWREVGMALRASTSGTAEAAELESGLSCRDGAEAFQQILSSPRPQWVVSTLGLEPADSQRARDAAVARVDAARPEARPEPRHASRTEEETLAQIWRDLLGVREPSMDDDFFALGGDSLLAIQLSEQLGSCFGVSVPLRQLMQAPTIASLATLLRSATATRRVAPEGAAGKVA